MALWNRQTYTNDGGSTKTSTKPKSTPVSYSSGQSYVSSYKPTYTAYNSNVVQNATRDLGLSGYKAGSTIVDEGKPYTGTVTPRQESLVNKSRNNLGTPSQYQTTKEEPRNDPPTYYPPTSYDYSGGSGYSSGSSGGSDSGSSSSHFDDLLAEFTRQSQAARDQFIAAIMKNLESVKGTYNNQIQQVKDEYQKLVNENEVKKERARRVIRENQANRGQLNSGLGRQELLDMNIGYDNITSNLNSARTKAVNDIYNLIAQAEAEAETNKANINNNYANSLLQYRLANQ